MKKSPHYDLIVFDWDGTIMDSASSIVSALQRASQDLDLPIPSDEASRHIIGLGLNEAMMHLFPDLSSSRYPQLVDRYRHHYLGSDHVIPLFAGMKELIQNLRQTGYLLAVATGKSRRGLDRALTVTELDGFFDHSRTADECFSKPHPAMLLELMTVMNVTPRRTIMIGDTSHDINMANNAAVPSIAVTYGAHPEAELKRCTPEPIAFIDSVKALRQWFEQWN